MLRIFYYTRLRHYFTILFTKKNLSQHGRPFLGGARRTGKQSQNPFVFRSEPLPLPRALMENALDLIRVFPLPCDPHQLQGLPVGVDGYEIALFHESQRAAYGRLGRG
jgi:hypothetical protein